MASGVKLLCHFLYIVLKDKLPYCLSLLACSSGPGPSSPGLGLLVLTTTPVFSKCRLWDGTQVFMLARQFLCLRADYSPRGTGFLFGVYTGFSPL